MYPPDIELIEKAKRKDEGAFAALCKRYKDRIYAYLYRYVNDHEKAKDLTLETFISIYKGLGNYKEIGKFSSWIYMIATNCAKKELRKNKNYIEISLDKAIDTEGAITLGDTIKDNKNRPDYNMRISELKELVYGIIAKLEEKYKDALFLCDVEGLTYKEAAKVLKCKAETVHTRARRARIMLYELLRKHGYEF